MEIVRLTELQKCFHDGAKGERQVLKGVDLTLESGDFVAVMGVSGAGKSTLLNILGLMCEADGGTYWLNGEQVSPMSNNALALRNRSVGFVFQDSRLLPHLTAWQNVLLPVLAARHETDKASEAWAEKLMQMTGVDNIREQLPETLSGGEKTRVALCRALVMHPDLLLADEPTGQLDEVTAREIGTLLQKLNKEVGTTIVVVTHDQKLAHVATRCYRLINGKLTIETY